MKEFLAGETSEELRSTVTIRDRAQSVYQRLLRGESEHFIFDEAYVDAAVSLVERVTKERYPSLNIPYHSRWRHLELPGTLCLESLEKALSTLPAEEKLARKIEIIVVSVLLDAGAGASWSYDDAISGKPFTRSEGLALASFRLVQSGVLSNSGQTPFEVSVSGLLRLQTETLSSCFQVGAANPLLGVEGRASLLRRMGESLSNASSYFPEGAERVGDLQYAFVEEAKGAPLSATHILSVLLKLFSPIWPSRLEIAGEPLGDVWELPGVGLIPFHKLSQWLCYSLVETMEQEGFQVRGLDALTALAEYRNGGLLLDSGVLRLRDENIRRIEHAPGASCIVEWRALTISLIDILAEQIRVRLGKPDLPLACVLEGGTWAAGRILAFERRSDGSPPLMISSDGTVF